MRPMRTSTHKTLEFRKAAFLPHDRLGTARPKGASGKSVRPLSCFATSTLMRSRGVQSSRQNRVRAAARHICTTPAPFRLPIALGLVNAPRQMHRKKKKKLRKTKHPSGSRKAKRLECKFLGCKCFPDTPLATDTRPLELQGIRFWGRNAANSHFR
jgi:hypothetical protein